MPIVDVSPNSREDNDEGNWDLLLGAGGERAKPHQPICEMAGDRGIDAVPVRLEPPRRIEWRIGRHGIAGSCRSAREIGFVALMSCFGRYAPSHDRPPVGNYPPRIRRPVKGSCQPRRDANSKPNRTSRCYKVPLLQCFSRALQETIRDEDA